MAAATLDRKRPFGAVIGDTEGRNFEQDGQFFRGDGSLWTPAQADPDTDAPAPAKPSLKKSKAAADPAPAAVDAQLDAQMGAA